MLKIVFASFGFWDMDWYFAEENWCEFSDGEVGGSLLMFIYVRGSLLIFGCLLCRCIMYKEVWLGMLRSVCPSLELSRLWLVLWELTWLVICFIFYCWSFVFASFLILYCFWIVVCFVLCGLGLFEVTLFWSWTSIFVNVLYVWFVFCIWIGQSWMFI